MPEHTPRVDLPKMPSNIKPIMPKDPTQDFLGRLAPARPLAELTKILRKTDAAAASGLWGSSVAAVTAILQQQLNRPILLICGHIDEADDLADDLELFHHRRPDILPALELSGSLGQVSEEQASNRLQLLARLATGGSGFRVQGSGNPALNPESRTLNPLIVAPIQSLMQSVPSLDQLNQLLWTIRTGQSLEPEKLIVWLSEHGYNRLDQVEVPGDFAVRGGIIDIYLPGEHEESGDQVGLTVRVDFFGDTVESIKHFDLDSLGSKQSLQSVRLIDLKGTLPETGDSTHFFLYLTPDTIVVLWAPLEIAEQAKSYFDRLPEVKGVYPLSAILKTASPFTRLELSEFGQAESAFPGLVGGVKVPEFRLPIRSLQKFETEVKKAVKELEELAQTHEVTIFCENVGEKQRFAELLDQDAPGLRQKLELPVGYLHRGFVYEESARPIALLGHHELFH